MLVCWSVKGGVGTSTVAAGVALALGARGRSLLVDLAGGGHPATTALTRGGHFNLVLDAITGKGLDMGPIRAAHARVAS